MHFPTFDRRVCCQQPAESGGHSTGADLAPASSAARAVPARLGAAAQSLHRQVRRQRAAVQGQAGLRGQKTRATQRPYEPPRKGAVLLQGHG